MRSRATKLQCFLKHIVPSATTYVPPCGFSFYLNFNYTFRFFPLQAKELLKRKGENVFIIELDELTNCDEFQKALSTRTKHRTVPQIFIKQEFIGGCDELEEMNSIGKLDGKLA